MSRMRDQRTGALVVLNEETPLSLMLVIGSTTGERGLHRTASSALRLLP
jgi:hypothetical protein